jgi:hypothetical protein
MAEAFRVSESGCCANVISGKLAVSIPRAAASLIRRLRSFMAKIFPILEQSKSRRNPFGLIALPIRGDADRFRQGPDSISAGNFKLLTSSDIRVFADFLNLINSGVHRNFKTIVQ